MQECEKNIMGEVSSESTKYGEEQFCRFGLGQTSYAVPLARVQEVVLNQTVAPIPRSPDHIRGLVDFRGQIVVSINIGKLLNVDTKFKEKSMNLIVGSEDSLCCLEVDKVIDVVDFGDKVLNEVPGNIDEKVKFFIEGIYTLDKGLTMVLNLDKILNTIKL